MPVVVRDNISSIELRQRMAETSAENKENRRWIQIEKKFMAVDGE